MTNTGTGFSEKAWCLSVHGDIQNWIGHCSRAISSSWPCSEQMISRGTFHPQPFCNSVVSTATCIELRQVKWHSHAAPQKDGTPFLPDYFSTSLPACHIQTGFQRAFTMGGHSAWGSVTHPYFCIHIWLAWHTRSYWQNHDELLTTTNTCRQLKSRSLQA